MMNFIDRKINNYRRIISKFLLDLSEKENSKFINFLSKNKILHRVLFNLKEIRKGQRKKSLRDLEKKKIGNGKSLLNDLPFIDINFCSIDGTTLIINSEHIQGGD